MKKGLQKTLGRVQPPRVRLTYDVEVGDEIRAKELPFILGIMADLSGEPLEALPPLAERQFATIDSDNFETVIKSIRPRLHLNWPNESSRAGVELFFESIDDIF